MILGINLATVMRLPLMKIGLQKVPSFRKSSIFADYDRINIELVLYVFLLNY